MKYISYKYLPPMLTAMNNSCTLRGYWLSKKTKTKSMTHLILTLTSLLKSLTIRVTKVKSANCKKLVNCQVHRTLPPNIIYLSYGNLISEPELLSLCHYIPATLLLLRICSPFPVSHPNKTNLKSSVQILIAWIILSLSMSL